MDFTVVDAGVAVIALVSGALAYGPGFTREMFALAGWAGAAVAAGAAGAGAATSSSSSSPQPMSAAPARPMPATPAPRSIARLETRALPGVNRSQ